MTAFEPRPAASIHTIGTRIAPTHDEPGEPEEPRTEAVDEEQVRAKVVTSPQRKGPRTTGADTK